MEQEGGTTGRGFDGSQTAGARASWPLLTAARAKALALQLAEQDQYQLAFELASVAVLAEDPEAACLRGGWALRLGRPELAVAAADVAIARLLHTGLTVEEFIRLSLRRAPAEALLRYERRSVAEHRHLHEPLALRWEALRRAGRKAEAREMRALCIAHFPERASVWSTAGSQALDDGELDAAQHYFERSLRCDADWLPGLAGTAIVHESRKDWLGALEFRRRVVEVGEALSRDDPASLQRLIRYAAALARLGRWRQAGVLFRRSLALGAFEALPAERPVLYRVFSRELYSPALIARMHARLAPSERQRNDEAALALDEASTLARVYDWLSAAGELTHAERFGLLGMCAWLAGNDAHAYALFDEAEAEHGDDLGVAHLLACCAAALDSDDRASIEAFSVSAASALLESARRGEPVRDEDSFYARMTLARFAPQALSAELDAPDSPWHAFYAHALASGSCPTLEPAPDGTELVALLRRLTAFRAGQLAAGRTALEAARASAEVVVALARLAG
jgi:tetratricopeptide (TPR) repeat protein